MIPPSIAGHVIVREESWEEDQTCTWLSMRWRAEVRRAGAAGVVKTEAGKRSGAGLIGAIAALLQWAADEDGGGQEQRLLLLFMT